MVGLAIHIEGLANIIAGYAIQHDRHADPLAFLGEHSGVDAKQYGSCGNHSGWPGLHSDCVARIIACQGLLNAWLAIHIAGLGNHNDRLRNNNVWKAIIIETIASIMDRRPIVLQSMASNQDRKAINMKCKPIKNNWRPGGFEQYA